MPWSLNSLNQPILKRQVSHSTLPLDPALVAQSPSVLSSNNPRAKSKLDDGPLYGELHRFDLLPTHRRRVALVAKTARVVAAIRLVPNAIKALAETKVGFVTTTPSQLPNGDDLALAGCHRGGRDCRRRETARTDQSPTHFLISPGMVALNYPNIENYLKVRIRILCVLTAWRFHDPLERIAD